MATPDQKKAQQSAADIMMNNVEKPKLPTSAQDLEPKHSDTPQAEAGEAGQQQSLERGEAIEAGPVRDEQSEAQRQSDHGASSHPMQNDLEPAQGANPKVDHPDLYGGHRQGGYGNDRVEAMETEDEGGQQDEHQDDGAARVVNGVDLDAPADESGFAPDPENPNAPKRLSGNEG
jgi:hypothetical protein